MRKTVCRICLRSDSVRTEDIDERLADFHDELCDYDVLQNDVLKFCSICEHLLRKFYNFKRKCRRAHKILKQKRKCIENLQELMPLSSIGFSTESDRQEIYNLSSDREAHFTFENITHYNLINDGLKADENDEAIKFENKIDTLSTSRLHTQGKDEEILRNEDCFEENDAFETEYLDLEDEEPSFDNDYEETEYYDDYPIQLSNCDVENPLFNNGNNGDEKQTPKVIKLDITNSERVLRSKLDKSIEMDISVEFLKSMNRSAVAKVNKNKASATKSSQILSCHKCGATFESRDTLQTHTRQTHGVYQCCFKDCIELFDTPESLHEHTVKEGHGRPPARPQQGSWKATAARGPRKRPPGRSSRARVTGPDKPYRICPVCKEQVSNTSCTALYAHHMLVHPKLPYAAARGHCYLCDQCGKSFAIRCVYIDHLNTHSGAKPYACSDCDGRFHTKRSLYIHSQRHRPPTHQCKECGKMFPTSSNLNLHRRTHIGDRRFKCGICSKGFPYRSSLKGHIDGVHNQIRRIKKPPKAALKQDEN